VPHGELGSVIASFTIYGCENGVRVVLESERNGWRKLLGSDRAEYVATDISDLVMVFERILGNDKVAAQLAKYLNRQMAVKD
jgi:hypothetical protein